MADKVSQSAIARRLGVHRSTISREIKRNSAKHAYLASHAERKLKRRRFNAARPRISQDTQTFVEYGLALKWSPEQISGKAAHFGISVSHTWIYSFIRSDRRHGGKLYMNLRRCGRRFRNKWRGKNGQIRNAVSIEKRPAIVNERIRLGDWEADLVMGKQGSGAIVTLAERKSRLYLVKKISSKESGEVADAIIELLTPYREQCHTITFDNGQEFKQHQRIAAELDASAYFAHPYSAHERGLNENLNGLLRQYIPKGTNIASVTHDALTGYQAALNNRPRKCLDYYTPQQIFMRLSGR